MFGIAKNAPSIKNSISCDYFMPKIEPAKSLYNALVKEMKKRSKCEGIEWIDNERNAIFQEAKKIAEENPSIYRIPTMKEVEMAENFACGHSDYTTQYAYNVARAMIGSK